MNNDVSSFVALCVLSDLHGDVYEVRRALYTLLDHQQKHLSGSCNANQRADVFSP
jgi:hypothetical protein